ncbi:hypothetical protein QKU48_gp0126 [Fadolivirus algeromassiliense]|jgi:transposase-like protein|uniref:C2H2-type domain-containing protein n=1 Tax=Fadolivirus FV1/VV64 TaxID=3070911 RepID=A0A7D3QUI9_9VIRU|nr:hypothetical protein QKU48_gp0126 [Fadolivirus algeromassiliense]QKF93584.1 hypothetical protein Fadolivirus_1_126 [Fadolivirus FV1/VV64]
MDITTNNKGDYFKNYYIKNKDKWYTEYKCEACDYTYNNTTKYRHFNSKKHKTNVELFELKKKLETIKENLQ